MKFEISLEQLCLLSALLPLVEAVPTGRSSNPSLRGSEALVGYSPTENVATGSKPDIKYSLLPGQKENPDLGAYLDFENVENPQPIRGSTGSDDPGPRNYYYDRINSDKLAPPGTDNGQTINAQLGIDNAGWARQENTVVMPDATQMAGVDMRLEPAAYRELHWHVAAEWSLVLNGSCRIQVYSSFTCANCLCCTHESRQAVNENGETFIDDLSAGDVWFFPPGIPHSIQALDDGVEFLLVFDQGDFSEDNTFLATEVFLHTPKEVLAKDLGTTVAAFDDIPDDELYIFAGTAAPKDIEKQNVTTASGFIPAPRATRIISLSKMRTKSLIVDPLTFPVASNFSAAIVTVHPGGMREIHWHPTSDEWTFFIQGQGRATLFTAPNAATTFDYRAGDIGYFPKSNSHYIENTGEEDLIFVEVLQASQFTDMALGQWIASTPRQIVKDTLKLSDSTLASLKTEKQYVVAGSNSTA
ncbi:uncharacterized protein N7477_005130 [Penicillium maclennaniae]|uniref:uncharacterized protein n=1 Tax=Penicillium maclennaniae TaxID=1343394 RepID=UPI002540B397|nr:uncharacterized protein N7477_005130 [Penicillium maclennaniae]KAJ5675196.1 hypothetical protein N7477_005130 [Penicillium maclennaniae]